MTMTNRSTVVGVFELRSEADAAIYELQRAGFRDEQIGFIVRNDDTGAATTVEDGNTTEAAPGAAVGAVSGGIIGGVIGAAAALLIPGIGPAIAGGILVTVLGGAAIGAAAGGIVGALVGMGVPEEEAHYYSGEFHSGRTLVTVRADGRQQEAINILHHYGGYDAGTRLGQAQQGQQAQAPTYTQADQVSVGRPTRDPGTYNPNTQADQMAEPGTSTGTSSNASSRHYDPVAGVTEKGNQGAPVTSSEYGLQRDPTVETDATANPKTYDRNVRPDPLAEDGSQDSSFERPVEPGTVEPGSYNDPNDHLPRI